MTSAPQTDRRPPESGAATLGAACADAARRLAGAVAEPRLEARLLVAAASGRTAETVFGYPERPLPPAARRALDGLIDRRLAGEPVSRLVGRREFWSLDFGLTPDTLDPRPDSETLIEAALADIDDREAPLAILDLGTGSGCLLLALLSELPRARGLGIDIGAGAVAAARKNAAALGLAARAAFRIGDWGEGIEGRFDVILCNPPYIPDREIDGLAPEVRRFDPRRALAGGPDGLGCYRALAPDLARLLAPGGVAVLELGADAGDAVAAILAAVGLRERGRRRDLGGRERALILAPEAAATAGAA